MTSYTWLAGAAWRGALVLAVAFVVARMLSGQRAALRTMLWTSALAAVMAMPLLTRVAPVVPVTVPQRVLQLSTPASDNSLGAAVAVKDRENAGIDGVTPSVSTPDTFSTAIQAVTTPWYRWF